MRKNDNITIEQKEQFVNLVCKGIPLKKAANLMNIKYSSGYGILKKFKKTGQIQN